MLLSNHPRIWCAISGHGYGHLAQLAPVINRLVDRYPDTRLHLACDLSDDIVNEKIFHPFDLDKRQQDIGLIQPDPFIVDRDKTRQALVDFHHQWNQRIEQEARLMTDFAPDLVIGDIPYLSFAAASRIGVPSVAIASLSWDRVLSAYFDIKDPIIQTIHQQMQQAYATATLALLPAPALEQQIFPRLIDIDPIHQPIRHRHGELRHQLGISTNDERPLVLVSNGGIRGQLPCQRIAQMEQCHWIVRGCEGSQTSHLHSVAKITQISYSDIVNSVDVILGKLGYNIAVEAISSGIPFIYIQRGTFPDEAPLREWVQQHGSAYEMSLKSFQQGDWMPSIESVLRKTAAPASFKGVPQAVDYIAEFLQ